MPQRVEGSIEIAVPVETVYGYWETLENLPNFMANVEEIVPTGPDTTRWRVKGPLGTTLEWEARTTHKEPNSTIGWITNAGADVDNSGVVRFRESAPSVTLVEVVNTLKHSRKFTPHTCGWHHVVAGQASSEEDTV
jgi:uncharacterized membrane protein